MTDYDYKIAYAKRLNSALDFLSYPPLNQGRIERMRHLFSVSQSAARKWILGLSLPSMARRKQIADRLGVNEAWLETGEGQMCHTHENHQSIPLLTFDALLPTPQIQHALRHIPTNTDLSRQAFALENPDDAMAPQFPPGATLIIDPQRQPQDGDFVIAKLATLPEPIFRQYRRANGKTYFTPINPDYAAYPQHTKDTVIGRLVQVMLQFS